MTLKQKLLLGFFSVILLLIGITGITYYQFHSIDNDYHTTIEEKTDEVKWITFSIMENYIEQVNLRSYLITNNAEELQNYTEATERLKENLDIVRAITTQPKTLELIDQFEIAAEEYYKVSEKLIAAKRQDDVEEIAKIMENEGAQARENIQSHAKELLLHVQNEFIESSDELSKQVNGTTNIVLWISILAVIIGIVVAIWISNNISKRVKQVSTSADEIANGNLSIELLDVKTKDEIGQLGYSFNKMTENLKNIIEQVGQTSEQVAASSEELLASSEESTAAINQVAASISEVANNVEIQGKNTLESSKGMSNITSGINRIAESASTVATSSLETTKQAMMGNENIQNVLRQMNTISEANTETNQVIQVLEKRSADIGKIIDVITDIADQTNLLALNAAIESARAGEHGKGFAVVADEVRKLAEQSSHSANQIAEIIKQIQIDTSRAADLMENGTTEVTNGLKLAEETGEMFGNILSSIENANAQTQELSAVSEEMSVIVEQVNVSIDEVSELAKTSSESTGEIAAATEEQLAASEEVTHAANSLASMAEELRSLVQRFKI